MGYNPSKYKCN